MTDTPSSLSAKEITRAAFSSWVERRKAILGDAAMSDDIVAELDRLINQQLPLREWNTSVRVILRARDEIVALRASNIAGRKSVEVAMRDARGAAAEERARCARIAENSERMYDGGVAQMIATAIRALDEEP